MESLTRLQESSPCPKEPPAPRGARNVDGESHSCPGEPLHAQESPPHPGEPPQVLSLWPERPSHRCGSHSMNKLTLLQPQTSATGTRPGCGDPGHGRGDQFGRRRVLQGSFQGVKATALSQLVCLGHRVRLGQSRARRLLALCGHHKSPPREHGPASPPSAVLQEIPVLTQGSAGRLCCSFISSSGSQGTSKSQPQQRKHSLGNCKSPAPAGIPPCLHTQVLPAPLPSNAAMAEPRAHFARLLAVAAEHQGCPECLFFFLPFFLSLLFLSFESSTCSGSVPLH